MAEIGLRPEDDDGEEAYGHTGFTGTSLWIDPEKNLYVVLLTNRVHPTRENNQIQAFRRQLHDEIADRWP